MSHSLDLVESRSRTKRVWAEVQRQKKDIELQITREQAELDELLHHDDHRTIH